MIKREKWLLWRPLLPLDHVVGGGTAAVAGLDRLC